MTDISIEVLSTFDDPQLNAEIWNGLLPRSSACNIFLTYEWQRTWWETFGRGQLLLVVAWRRRRIIAIAPFFHEAGMIYLVGSGGSDYLGFVGDVSEPDLLARMLDEARDCVPEFIGLVLYLLPESSGIERLLEPVARRLQLELFEEGELPAPQMEITTDRIEVASSKKSLLRHERYFRREGEFEVCHTASACEILPHLNEFFEQHINRWAGTAAPSLFHDAQQRTFYRRLTEAAAPAGWLRFTILRWNGRPVAFHFGFCHGGCFLWYKPSFEIELARHSPGEVLLRQLLLSASAEGATVFDFGIGDEPFKRRFATSVQTVRTWGLYEPKKLIETLQLASGGADDEGRSADR